ncbi:hypothetical protein AN477_11210 [Alicyclobacillus ferrooxydans]|uniref:Major facilitator superfamily (MFS) profile domain-containing protein n=1 Tax=Alicyclobacillus ferrooxydans TaxID=471514 RepID=A0A0N8PP97_9BACL|nr:hypothetical protein AN477_11210 [Alicyclobacillus ferrooxydans]
MRAKNEARDKQTAPGQSGAAVVPFSCFDEQTDFDEQTETKQNSTYGGVLLNHKLRLQIGVYVSSRGISRIGDFMLLIGINLSVLNATHSPTAVSILWIIPAIAQLIVSPWAGSITDRMDKRTTMMTIDIIRAFIIAAMALFSNIWVLYIALFLVNSVGTFFPAAAMPYMTYLVPKEHRKRVNGINGSLTSGAIVIGPAITGMIVHITGSVTLAIWLDALSFLLSALAMFILPSLKSNTNANAPKTKTKNASPETSDSGQSVLQTKGIRIWTRDLADALRILSDRPVFTILFVLTALSGAFGAATDSQEVVFARSALHLSSGAYGLLVAIAGLGYVLGALLVTFFAKKLSLQLLIGLGSIVSSIGFVVYAFSHSFLLAALGFVILGVFLSLSGAGQATFNQSALPAEFMGRVSNVISPIRQLLIILLTVGAGLVASLIGVRHMTIGSTSIMLLLSLVTAAVVASPLTKRVLRAADTELIEAAYPRSGSRTQSGR